MDYKYIIKKVEYIKSLEEIFKEDGEDKGKKANESYEVSSAQEAYKVINDYILEGMPCDAVDQVIEEGKDKFIWLSRQCIHSDNWKAVGGNVQHFYDLRQVWLESFLSQLGDGYNFSSKYMDGARLNTITSKKQPSAVFFNVINLYYNNLYDKFKDGMPFTKNYM